MPIRPFHAGDVSDVAALHRRVFASTDGRDPGPPEAYHRFLAAVFLSGPACDDEFPSLVHEDERGRISGFLGVNVRRMTMGGRTLRAALTSQFFVDPDRKDLAALALVRAFLAGPQDLSLADASNDSSRRVWEASGGRTALFHSLHWLRVLRPGRAIAEALGRRPGLRALAAFWKPLAPAMDAVLPRVPANPLRPPAVELSAERLEPETIVHETPRLLRGRSLVPLPDAALLRWLLLRREKEEELGRLESVVVRSREGRLLGWSVAHVPKGGLAEVLQVAAGAATVGPVLDDLFWRAWQGGATAVSGNLDPIFVQPLSDRYCIFHRRAPWVLVHSRSPEVLAAATASDAFLSRLDGEWGIRFLRGNEPEAGEGPTSVAVRPVARAGRRR